MIRKLTWRVSQFIRFTRYVVRRTSLNLNTLIKTAADDILVICIVFYRENKA